MSSTSSLLAVSGIFLNFYPAIKEVRLHCRNYLQHFGLFCQVVPEECGVAYSSRVQCLSDDVTEEQCTAHSCCYDIRYTPHCYQGNPPGMRYFHLYKPTYWPTQWITIFFHLRRMHSSRMRTARSSSRRGL